MSAIKYESVSKSFNEIKAVQDVSFEIEEDQIFGLLGPNGAGKTTLIRLTLQIYLPDRGKISIFSKPHNLINDKDIGYLPEERGLYPKMKCLNFLKFILELKGYSPKNATKKAMEGLEKVGLKDFKDKKIEELSKGMQQKIQLLAALNHNPKLAILDEPFSGLDPVNVEFFKDLIKEHLSKGNTVVLSSHQMDLVEQLCKKIALINKGKIVLFGDVKEIKRKYGENKLYLEFSNSIPFELITNLSDSFKTDERSITLTLKKDVEPKSVILKLYENGYDITKFEVASSSLHDIFVKVVKEEN